MKLRLEIEIEYDEAIIHGDDADAKDWFMSHILGDAGDLLLHSNAIGDTIGTVKVLSIGSEGGWRDMESAPKTGSILVYRDGRMVMAHWDDQKHRSNPKPYWASETSWTSVRRDREQPPQAWMPLPNPPNAPDQGRRASDSQAL